MNFTIPVRKTGSAAYKPIRGCCKGKENFLPFLDIMQREF
jgi:hypothetical protein